MDTRKCGSTPPRNLTLVCDPIPIKALQRVFLCGFLCILDLGVSPLSMGVSPPFFPIANLRIQKWMVVLRSDVYFKQWEHTMRTEWNCIWTRNPELWRDFLIYINSVRRSEFLSNILQQSKFLYALIILWAVFMFMMCWFCSSSFLKNDTMRVCVRSYFGHVRLFATLWTIAHQAPLSMGFSSKNTGVGAVSFSRGSSQLRDQTHVS